MRESVYDKSDEIAKTIATKIGELQEAINEGLGQEIQGLSNQGSSILKEKEAKEFNVQQKLQELKSIEEELNGLESDLDELIIQVAIL
jgi:DNA polymerase/3'-5' exonuclease PolX